MSVARDCAKFQLLLEGIAIEILQFIVRHALVTSTKNHLEPRR